MTEIFDDFLNDGFFTLGFDRPRNLIFNTPGTKDIHPACWEETENGYKAICRTVGINPDDVVVDVKEHCILVSGKTECDGIKYSTSYELPISEDILANIRNVEYKTINGITYIYLNVIRPEKREIKAVRID